MASSASTYDDFKRRYLALRCAVYHATEIRDAALQYLESCAYDIVAELDPDIDLAFYDKVMVQAQQEGALTDAIRPNGANDAEYQNALRRPLVEITKAIRLAHQLGVMTKELNDLCASVLDDVSPEELEVEHSGSCLTYQEQGTFSLGYAKYSPLYSK